MRGNGRRVHAAFRKPGRNGPRTAGIVVKLSAACVAAGVTVYLFFAAYSALNRLWISQCVVEDVKEQVTVRTSAHVREEVVLELFGLRKGCNLAEIDFGGKRREILAKRPLIKAISVTRRPPDRVEIDIEERVPVARVNFAGKTRDTPFDTWDVADADGVVFDFPLRDSRTLPRIVGGKGAMKVPRGERLPGKAMSALRLIDISSRKEYPHVTVLDVNISNDTYLIAALSDYSIVKFDWSFVDDPADPGQPHLANGLSNIEKIVSGGTPMPIRCTFIVSEAGRVGVMPYEKDALR